MPLIALTLLAGCNRVGHAEHRAPTAGGFVSLDRCADQLLVALAPARRVAAISSFSRDPQTSALPPETALRFRTVGPAPADVIEIRPTLALAGPDTSAPTLAALRRHGVRTLVLTPPADIAAVRAQLGEVGAALDENAAAAALVGRIDRALGAPRRTAIPAQLLLPDGTAAASGSLADALLTHAGFRNVAGSGQAPRVIFRTRGVRAGDHGAASAIPAALTRCGGPAVLETLDRFAAARDAIAR